METGQRDTRIHKVNPNLTSNYGPVPLLSVVGKSLKKVFKYLFNYYHSINIIYE